MMGIKAQGMMGGGEKKGKRKLEHHIFCPHVQCCGSSYSRERERDKTLQTVTLYMEPVKTMPSIMTTDQHNSNKQLREHLNRPGLGFTLGTSEIRFLDDVHTLLKSPHD